MLSGITETAARMIDPTYSVGPEVNWMACCVERMASFLVRHF
ncbi:Aminobenzoyl-glutamate transport protein [Vibrio cholerae]|nr:Aminobenzoyl-glutamate transport protein [Vibrio cholerae]